MKKSIAVVVLLAACSSPVPAGPDAGMDAASPPDTGELPDVFAVDAPIECSAPGDCPVAVHATARCASNHCEYDCATGFGNCDDELGCEQPLDVASHCGACTTDCGATGYCETDRCRSALTPSWLQRIRSATSNRPRDMVIDEARSRVITVGYVEGGASVTVGTTSTTGAGGAYDAYIAAINDVGTVVWAYNIGGSGEDFFTRIAVTEDGHIVAVGSYTAAFGMLPPVRGGADGFVMILDATGSPVSATTWNGVGDDSVDTVAIGPDGAIFVSGRFSADTSLAGASRSPAAGATDPAIVRYDSSLSSPRFLPMSASRSEGSAQVVFQGERLRAILAYDGTVDLGSGGRFSSTAPSGTDVLLLDIDRETLGVVGALSLGGTGNDAAVIAAHDEELLSLVFDTNGALELGGPAVPAPAGAGLVVLGLNGDDEYAWQFVVAGDAVDETSGYPSGDGANTFFQMRFNSPVVDLGGVRDVTRISTRVGDRDALLVSLDRLGHLRWVSQYGSPSCDTAVVSTDFSAGHGFLTGFAQGPTCAIATRDVSSSVEESWVHAIDL